MGGTSTRVRRQLDIVPAIPPRGIGYHHVSTEVWDKHVNDHTDGHLLFATEAARIRIAATHEEHPPFPLDLIHLKPSEHTHCTWVSREVHVVELMVVRAYIHKKIILNTWHN